MSLFVVLLGGCLFDRALYEKQRALLTDDDEDGQNEVDGDCDDADPARYSGAAETCDGVDQDCSGEADDGATDATWYPDADTDGYGDATAAPGCPETGWVEDATDCDDADAGVSPAATETCDAIDRDCDGDATFGASDASWYADADGDGFGAGEPSCDSAGRVETDGDCDDGASTVHPGADETCDGRDEDCDDQVDDDAVGAVPAWFDLDGDGQGDPSGGSVLACLPAEGFVDNDADCDDEEARVYAGAPEHIDGLANDCAGGGEPDVLTDADADVTFEGIATGDRAGAALLAPGDLDGDGQPDLVVGGPGAGQVYAVRGPFASASLSSAALTIDGWDGAAIAAGAFDGDGAAEIALTEAGGIALIDGSASGASSVSADIAGVGVSSLATLAGGTLAVGGDGSAWVLLDGPVSTLDDAPMRIDGLGGAGVVADAGDLDGDGISELLVGVPAAAMVYVFDPDDGVLTPAAARATITGTSASELGAALTSAGDHDGDGARDLLVGAPGYDDAGQDDGRAYVFYGPTAGSLTADAAGTTVSGRGAGARLGASVGAADVDGEGTDDIWVGVPSGINAGASDAGFVLLYRGYRLGGLTVGEADAVVGGSDDADALGTAIAVGDLSGDERADLVVGGDQDRRGAVYLFVNGW